MIPDKEYYTKQLMQICLLCTAMNFIKQNIELLFLLKLLFVFLDLKLCLL